MSKLILFFKSHPFVLSLLIGVVSVSTAVTAVLLPGPQGEPGKEVEFRVTNESIEYRYEGDTEYSSLIDLSQLRGPIGENGKQVIFDINDTHIIWRYSDQNTWINLILLDSLKGLTGRNGTSVELDATSTHIVWKYVDDQTWTNLIDLSLLKGQDGTDGRDVEFQTSETHLQWRYDGESTWNDLIALSLLKGQDGAGGTKGNDGVDGTNGNDGVDGRDVEIDKSISYSVIAGQNWFLGGFVGGIENAYVSFSYSYSYGSIVGDDYIGGFVGIILSSSKIYMTFVLSDLLFVLPSGINAHDLYGFAENTALVYVSFSKQLTEELINN